MTSAAEDFAARMRAKYPNGITMLEKEGVPEKLKAAADHVDLESVREDAKAMLEAIDAKDDLDAVLAFAAMAAKFGLGIALL